ncbi:MAG: hypothetical protein Kapaf2KO_22530 [Candidatus Kapaibacteriales bacterium]
MKKSTRFILVNLTISIFIFLFSCQEQDEPEIVEEVEKPDKLLFRMNEMSYFPNWCDTSSMSCVTLSASYPEFYLHEKGYSGEPSSPLGRKESVAEVVNREVLEFVTGGEFLGKNILTPKAAFDSLYSIYKIDSIEFGTLGAYALEYNVKVETDKYGILTISKNSYSYMGGAHPNHSTVYSNYDLYTGNRIILNDILKDSTDKVRFSSIAAKILADSLRREMSGYIDLDDADNLKMSDVEIIKNAGYYIGDTFELNENFKVSRSGITFLYNPYEIAPYVFGYTKIHIPYTTLKSFISPSSAIQRMYIGKEI